MRTSASCTSTIKLILFICTWKVHIVVYNYFKTCPIIMLVVWFQKSTDFRMSYRGWSNKVRKINLKCIFSSNTDLFDKNSFQAEYLFKS